MGSLGIVLGIAVAVLWGSADTVATVAARRLGTFTTTLVSFIVSASVLVLFGVVSGFGGLAFVQISLAPQELLFSASIGLLSGLLAAVGYFSLYRGLELGPLAIVSPIVAADGAVAAVLAILLLHEGVSVWQASLLCCIFCGIFFASTNLAELRRLLVTSGSVLVVKGGVPWGLLAMLAFGLMLFTLGAAAQVWGWFLPIFWTRFFAMLAMLGLALWRHYRRSPGAPTTQGRRGFVVFGSSAGLAAVVGLLETVGLLVYSIDTQIAATDIAAAISSCFGLIPLVIGLTVFGERPTGNQVGGVLLVITALLLLAIKPA